MNLKETIATVHRMQVDGVITAFQTGRAKDKARLLQFIESGVLDFAHFQTIVSLHGLMDRWQKFERQFLGNES